MTQDNSADLRRRFVQDGFVIVPGVVPAAQLKPMRKMVEGLVERARHRDSTWFSEPTPRFDIAHCVDVSTIDTLSLVWQDNTVGISARLLDRDEDQVALNQTSVLCNPETDPPDIPAPGQSWGTDPRNWHRDVRPDHDGPLGAILDDERANGPGYVQWNIALYDDAVLHFVPGSHRRLTLEAEALQLDSDGGTQSPLDQNLCARLEPGDGVAYNSVLLHWGRNYTSRQKRRTIHLGYRDFGRILPHQWRCGLSASLFGLFEAGTAARSWFDRWLALYRSEFAVIERALLAVAAGDDAAFNAALVELHPAEPGRVTSVILMSKIARQVCELARDDAGATAPDHAAGPLSGQMQRELASRLTESQLAQLAARFGPLDAMLRGGQRAHVRGFLGPPTEYVYEQLPPKMTWQRVLESIFGSAVESR